MRIAILQLSPEAADTAGRLARVSEMLDAAGDAELVCLPEVWTPGYPHFDRWAAEAEAVPGELTGWLAAQAARRGCMLHGGSIIERDGDRLFNTALLFGRDGRLLARYRKIHLFRHAGREKDLLAAGDELVTVDTWWAKIGLATCYDVRFPEQFRGLLDKGATAFVVPAAWRTSALVDWRLLCQARALENQCFLIAAAVAGEAADMSFPGHSMVVDPTGRIVAEAGETETILTADIDPAQVARARREFPVLDDRTRGQ